MRTCALLKRLSVQHLVIGLVLATQPAFHVVAAQEPKLLQEFTLKEHFGVTHADQVVVFELQKKADPDYCHLLDDAGKEVPFQSVDGGPMGSIAFCMDLPANATRTFKLMAGRGSQAFDGVKVDESHPDYIEIINGLTGVRVPKVYAPLTTTPKAPIQGVRFRDGRWSPPGMPLKFKNSNNEGEITRVDAMKVTVKEKGPIRAVVEVRYDLTCPELTYGALKLRPAGSAHYNTTFTLERGQPSVLIETDTDLYSSFSFSLHEGVRPTQLRYCGSNASEAKYGRIEDGSKYPVVHSRPGMDAIVDLDYSRPVEVEWATGDGTRGWMRLWDFWASNTGYYWHMYDAGGKPEGNLAGIFAGAPSRLIGAGGSGPGIYNRPGPDVGITVQTSLRGGNNSLFLSTSKRTIRFAWGIYAGTRADAPDKLTDIPGIKKQWVLHGNGINLQKLIRWQLDYPDPNPPFGAMYMPRPAIEAMIQKLRTNEAYLQACRNNDPYNRDLFDMWLEPTGAKAHAMAEQLHKDMRDLVDDWSNGHGYLSMKYSSQPWLIPPSKVDRYDQVLASGFLSPEEKTRLKAGIALFANWLWDHDQYPFQTGDDGQDFIARVNMGNPNMIGQWMGARGTYTWFIASHPAMAPRLKAPAGRVDSVVPSMGQVNDFGAPSACPHYAGTLTPIHNVVMQRNMLGYKDWETDPKLPRLADWFLNIMSPADIRFGGLRNNIVDGDSQPCDGAVLLGEMATACAASHPDLSKRLMWMWQANGKRHSGFYASSHLRIREELPAEDPKLGNAAFPNYCAVLRSQSNTPYETSVHAIMGDSYYDHRGSSSGELMIYALGVPLSLGWESMYSPHNPTPYSRCGVVPEKALSIAWNVDLPSVYEPGEPWDWKTQRQDAFASFRDSAWAKMSSGAREGDLKWTRQVASIHPDPACPLLLIRDTLEGGRATEPMIFNMHLVAEGPLETCAGPVTPGEAFWDVINDKNKQKPPAGGKAHPMPAGLNRFAFKGQQFGKAGETPAIDFDLYSLSGDAREFCLGSWGHNVSQGAHVDNVFRPVNGRPYELRQHLLHIKGARGFTTLIVPRLKGAAAPVVTQNDEAFKVATPGGTVLLSADGYTYVGADAAVATAFGAAAVVPEGLSAAGGPTEVVHDKKAGTITVTAHGPGGKRLIGVPDGRHWQAQDKALVWDAAAMKWRLDYAGGKPGETQPATLVLKETPARLGEGKKKQILLMRPGKEAKEANEVQAALEKMGQQTGLWTVVVSYTGNEVLDPGELAKYHVFFVYDCQPGPEATWKPQGVFPKNLFDWISKGGALIAFHSGFLNREYCKYVGGERMGHPWGGWEPAPFVNNSPDHPIMKGTPLNFQFSEEIFDWNLRDTRLFPEHFHLLFSVDMAKAKPKVDHVVPVTGVGEYGEGRIYFNHWGHWGKTFKDPWFQDHLLKAIRWAIE